MITFEVDWHKIPIPPEKITHYYKSKEKLISWILQNELFSLNDTIYIDEENQFKIVKIRDSQSIALTDEETLELKDARLVGCSYFRLYGEFNIVKKKLDIADEIRPKYRKISSLERNKFKPILAIWTVTNRCNLTCKHCYYYGQNISHIKELDTKSALKVIDRLASSSLQYISFSGGEPLMRRDIFQLMEYAVKNGLSVILDTNATLITENIAKILAEIGVTAVIGSLDGNQSTHESLRGTRSFNLVLEAVQVCRKQDIYVVINTVVNAENIDSLEDIAAICVNNDVNVLKYESILPAGRAVFNKQLLINHNSEQAEAARGERRITDGNTNTSIGMKIHQKINSIRKMYLNRLPIITPVPSEAFLHDYSFRCLSGKSFISISCNGNIAPCPSLCFLYENKGNIYSLINHSLNEISHIADFRPSAQLEKQCRSCIYTEACLSGCMTRSYYYNNNMLSTDPLCIEKRKMETVRT